MAPKELDETRIQDKLNDNPLIRKICGIMGNVNSFKQRARQFYFEVILSSYSCPVCDGSLHMSGISQCTCSCGKVFDPTCTFQKSTCCGARLTRKIFHYACSRCHKTVASQFLFDEKIFDKQYFRHMMRESRQRVKRKKEELKRFLANSRSDALKLTENPELESVPGLVEDLNAFVQAESDTAEQAVLAEKPPFRMNDYRRHINSILTWDSILFSEIVPLIEDIRIDKIWRFITLIYMQQDREVNLCQYGKEVMIKKVYHEAHT